MFLRRYNVGVDFDIFDCLARLTDDGLVTRTPAGEFAFPALAEAADHYDRRWKDADCADVRGFAAPPAAPRPG